jgi:hypothetical protein
VFQDWFQTPVAREAFAGIGISFVSTRIAYPIGAMRPIYTTSGRFAVFAPEDFRG